MHTNTDSAIVSGSGEGIPRDSSCSNPWWHAVTRATSCSPIVAFYAVRSHQWVSVAALIAVFTFQFFAIHAYKNRRGINSVLQWLAVTLVLTTNMTTYFIATNLISQPLSGSTSIGELQIVQTLLYIPFGVMRTSNPKTLSDE